MQIKPIFFLFILHGLLSCNSTDSGTSETLPLQKESVNIAEHEMTGLERAFQLFIENSVNDSAKKAVVYEIFTDGALPTVRLLESAQIGRVFKNRIWKTTKAKENSLPAVNCDNESFYDKTGIYISKENTLNTILPHIEFGKTDKQNIEQALQEIEITVVNTLGHIQLYFKLNEGKLMLVAINTIKPCEG